MPLYENDKLKSLLTEEGEQKRKAALARFSELGQHTHPRNLFLTCCAQVAECFVEDGFRYAKSGPQITRLNNGIKCGVFFFSSHNNVQGQHVALQVVGNVRSRKLKNWREQNSGSGAHNDWIGGGLIHLLGDELPYLKWNLAANPSDLAITLADVVAMIESIIVPFFDQFKDADALISEMNEQPVSGVKFIDSIEYCLMYQGQESAQKTMAAVFDHRPDLLRRVNVQIERFKQRGVPQRPLSDASKELAFCCCQYGLKPEN